MEETYPTESFPYVSPSFRLREYFQDYTRFLSETLYRDEVHLSTKETQLQKISFLMDIDEDSCRALSEACSVEQFGTSHVDANSLVGKRTDPSKSLEEALLNKATLTLATAAELKSLKSKSHKYHQKIKSIKKVAIPHFLREPIPTPLFRIPHDFVVVARVFRPFNSNSSSQSISHSHDFMLLGSMNLCNFREKITCLNDEVVIGDAQNYQSNTAVPMKRLFTSAMFYFGDTFYCDTRDMMSKDYGRVIDDWVKSNPNLKLGPFRHQPMQNNTVADLEIRLGYPYMFMHLGSCEHLITFLDARLMTPEDPQDPAAYPLVVERETSIKYCCACDTYETKWIVEDDAMPHKPSNLCGDCYQSFYMRKGQQTTPAFSCILPVEASKRKPEFTVSVPNL